MKYTRIGELHPNATGRMNVIVQVDSQSFRVYITPPGDLRNSCPIGDVVISDISGSVLLRLARKDVECLRLTERPTCDARIYAIIDVIVNQVDGRLVLETTRETDARPVVSSSYRAAWMDQSNTAGNCFSLIDCTVFEQYVNNRI
jgi:hypothetical protein